MSSTTTTEHIQPTISTKTSTDLRHVTSASNVHRLAHAHAHPQVKLGSRSPQSPGSIPSSPTSVHSSSSAIFERDIEPISPTPSLTLSPHHANSQHHQQQHPKDPHRIPRAHSSTEQSVPSVLDSAAAILTSVSDDEEVSVVAPASASAMGGGGSLFGGMVGLGVGSGFASPIGSLRSRSPSPLGVRVGEYAGGGGGGGGGGLGIQIPSPIPNQVSPHVLSSALPSGSPPRTLSVSTPSPPAAAGNGNNANTKLEIPIPTPTLLTTSTSTSTYFTSADTNDSPPLTTTASTSPFSLPLPNPLSQTLPHSHPQTHSLPLPLPLPISPVPSSHSHTSHSPKRLSFMSYTDLLSSTPASSIPLAQLTTAASSSEPPPHLPSVSASVSSMSASVSPISTHPHSPTFSSVPLSLAAFDGGGAGAGAAAAAYGGMSGRSSIRGVPVGGLTHPGKRDSIALIDDVGGEWEREGLGRGLEERLEGVVVGAGAK